MEREFNSKGPYKMCLGIEARKEMEKQGLIQKDNDGEYVKIGLRKVRIVEFEDCSFEP